MGLIYLLDPYLTRESSRLGLASKLYASAVMALAVLKKEPEMALAILSLPILPPTEDCHEAFVKRFCALLRACEA